MLSEDEKEAIEQLNKFAYSKHEWFSAKQADTVLNLITKLQNKIEEKNKQIDLMAEYIYLECRVENNKNICKNYNEENSNYEYCEYGCKDCISEYFEKLVKENKNE